MVGEHPLYIVVPSLQKGVILKFTMQKLNVPLSFVAVLVEEIVRQVFPQLLLNRLLLLYRFEAFLLQSNQILPVLQLHTLKIKQLLLLL